MKTSKPKKRMTKSSKPIKDKEYKASEALCFMMQTRREIIKAEQGVCDRQDDIITDEAEILLWERRKADDSIRKNLLVAAKAVATTAPGKDLLQQEIEKCKANKCDLFDAKISGLKTHISTLTGQNNQAIIYINARNDTLNAMQKTVGTTATAIEFDQLSWNHKEAITQKFKGSYLEKIFSQKDVDILFEKI